jgi:hypothetical protein
MIRTVEHQKAETSHLSSVAEGSHGLTWAVSEGDVYMYSVVASHLRIGGRTLQNETFNIRVTIDALPSISENISDAIYWGFNLTHYYYHPRPNVTITFDNGTDCQYLERLFILLPKGNWSFYTAIFDDNEDFGIIFDGADFWGAELEWLSDAIYWGFTLTREYSRAFTQIDMVVESGMTSFQVGRTDGVLHSLYSQIDRLSYSDGSFDERQEYSMHQTSCTNPCMLDRLDNDADDINNHQEALIGTDPNNNDTDSDFMPDGWEYHYQLDPLADDSLDDPDQDGLSNLGEYLNNADPRDSDTDSDSIPDGQEVHTYGTSPNDKDTEDDLMPDGWEVVYGLNPLANDSYDDFDSDGLHNLMEHELGTSPISNDTDADLASDGWEFLYGFDPLAAFDGSEDADGEGLVNYEEERYGTDPWSEDTDQDGFSDFWEIQNNFDPLESYVSLSQHVVANTGLIIVGIMGITVSFAGHRYILFAQVRAHKRRLREEEEEIRRTFEELVNWEEDWNSE